MKRIYLNYLSRFTYLSLIVATATLLSACSNSSPKKTTAPDIILISVDDMGWSDIGCYGGEIDTPNLDKLAKGGLRFTQFHNTSKCFPSRACLITGLYAQEVGLSRTHTNHIKNGITLGEYMRGAGYRTLWSGKHHGVDNPFDRGFDRYYGLRDGACNHFNPGEHREGEAKPAQKRNNRAWCIDSTTYQPYTPDIGFYTTDAFTDHALNWLDEYSSDSSPIFLYLSYTAPHDPLMAWPEDIAKYRGRYDSGYSDIRNARFEKQRQIGLIDDNYTLSKATHREWDSLSDEERLFESQKMEVYAAMIDRLDQNIGRLLAKLKEQGRDKNTLILFVSDNGASAENVNLKDDDKTAPIGDISRWVSLNSDWANVANTPFKMFKNSSMEGGINTPCITYWSGKIEPNSFTSFPGHFIDIMATFVDITKSEYPTEYAGESIKPYQGESLLPTLLGEERAREKPIYWNWQRGKAYRDGNWKIVKHKPETEWSLYNLETDPTESTDLSSTEVERVKVMVRAFNKMDSNYK